MSESLHAHARAVLVAWDPPDVAQSELRDDFVAHLDSHEDGMWRTCRPDHLTGSAVVVRGDDVLLVLHGKAGKWLQMGGHCEVGDSTLADVALREASEESGIADLEIDPVPLLLSRHRVPSCGGGAHLDVQFLVTAPAHAAPEPEIGGDPVQWFASPPEPTDQAVRDLIAAARHRLGNAS